MIKSVKRVLISNIKNIPGWKTKRKIIVFESDDWGSIRMPDATAFQNLKQSGFNLQNYFDRYDSLESSGDLEALYEVLSTVRDINNKHAVFTPFVNTANPDFEKIEASQFNEYYYEPFTDTLARYNNGNNLIKNYKEGIDNGVFQPQYHGREHLNVISWMKFLKDDHSLVKKAFENRYYSVPVQEHTAHILKGFRPTFYFDSKNEIEFLKKALVEGAKIFNNIFGFQPTVIDPPNGVFSNEFNETLRNLGIMTIVTNRYRNEPDGEGKVNKVYYNFGQINNIGQTHYIRNCQFELYDKKDENYCLADIRRAFRWNKPAIICSHRINFVGGLDMKWRDNNLIHLRNLLLKIVQTWPDVEFMSSGEFAAVMRKDILVRNNL